MQGKGWEPLKGTTTVGIVCKGGVVFATDTRVTSGYFIAHRRGKKVYQIDSHLAMTIAGGVADAQNVVDTLKFYANIYRLQRGIPMPVRAASRLVANVLFSARLFPYIAEVLVGGYEDAGSRVFKIDLFGSLTEEKFVATGSGSPVAYGVLEDGFQEGLSLDEGALLAVRAVTAAIKRNIGTGDGFDVAVIDKAGFRELSLDEKRALLQQIPGSGGLALL
jgi:proteasome beta subunit